MNRTADVVTVLVLGPPLLAFAIVHDMLDLVMRGLGWIAGPR